MKKKSTSTKAKPRSRAPRSAIDPVVAAICIALDPDNTNAQSLAAAQATAARVLSGGILEIISDQNRRHAHGTDIQADALAMVRRQSGGGHDDYTTDCKTLLDAVQGTPVEVDGGVVDGMLRQCVDNGVLIGVAIGVSMLRGGAR